LDDERSRSPVDPVASYRKELSVTLDSLIVGSHAQEARRTTWPVFVEHFEAFTEVLCCAAQFGVTSDDERRYADLREWFLEHYYEHAARVRQQLSRLSPAKNAGVSVDPLEAIFLPRSLKELLLHDRGNLIGQISGLSDAVYFAGE